MKQYLVSINDEVQENFKLTIQSIKEEMAEEVFKAPFQSGFSAIKTIVNSSLDKFIDDVVTIMDYYTNGIYDSGKNISRKKLKLSTQKEASKRYNFTNLDENFIDRFKYQQLNSFGDKLKKASVGYVVYKISNKVQDLWGFVEDDAEKFNYTRQELIDDEMDELVEIVINTISSIYSEIVESITKEIILLFKSAQIEEYKNLGINNLRIKSSNDEQCCSVCKTRSLQVYDINQLFPNQVANKDILHPFCKISIEPIVDFKSYKGNNSESNLSEIFTISHEHNFNLNSEIKQNIESVSYGNITFYSVPTQIDEHIAKLMQKIKIYLSRYINPIDFVFVNDVIENKEWFDQMKTNYLLEYDELKADTKTHRDQDDLRGKIISFRLKDKVLISNFALYTKPIEDIIIRELIRELEINDLQWWESKFEDKSKQLSIGQAVNIPKSPFVNFLAQTSMKDFILESIVCYVNNPFLLQATDSEVYEKISSDVFNGMKFK